MLILYYALRRYLGPIKPDPKMVAWSDQTDYPVKKIVKSKNSASDHEKVSIVETITETTVSFMKDSNLHGIRNVINDFEEISTGTSR